MQPWWACLSQVHGRPWWVCESMGSQAACSLLPALPCSSHERRKQNLQVTGLWCPAVLSGSVIRAVWSWGPLAAQGFGGLTPHELRPQKGLLGCENLRSGCWLSGSMSRDLEVPVWNTRGVHGKTWSPKFVHCPCLLEEMVGGCCVWGGSSVGLCVCGSPSLDSADFTQTPRQP